MAQENSENKESSDLHITYLHIDKWLLCKLIHRIFPITTLLLTFSLYSLCPFNPQIYHSTGDKTLPLPFPFPFPFADSFPNFPAPGPNSGSGFALSYSSDLISLYNSTAKREPQMGPTQ